MKKSKAKRVTKRDLYQEVTDKILASLEKGVIPWICSWSKYGMARNAKTGHIYSGINALMMNFTEHPIPYFLSYKQAQERGGQVRKGARAERVYFFNVLFKDATGNTLDAAKAQAMEKAGQHVDTRSYLKYYSVFNIEDIEGIEMEIPQVALKPNEKIEKCETILAEMKNPPQRVFVNADQPFYSPPNDALNMPDRKQFSSSEAYYCTLFHELTHATGHQSRLARSGITEANKFGSKAYGEEELIAEMGAAFLSAHCNIDRLPLTENSAAYIEGWMKKIKQDKKLIFKAAAAAQKAVNYILVG